MNGGDVNTVNMVSENFEKIVKVDRDGIRADQIKIIQRRGHHKENGSKIPMVIMFVLRDKIGYMKKWSFTGKSQNLKNIIIISVAKGL